MSNPFVRQPTQAASGNPFTAPRSAVGGNPFIQRRSLAPVEEPPGEFSKGMQRGFQQLQADIYGAGSLLGNALGIESLERKGAVGYARNIAEAEAPSLAPRTGRIEQIEDFGGAMDWLAGTAGSLVPTLATVAAGGGVGGAAAKGAVSLGVRQAAKKGVASAVGRVAGAQRLGQTAGAFVPYATQTSGGLHEEIKERTGEAQPGKAAVGGAAQAALGVLPVMAVFKRLGLMDAARKGMGEIAKTSGAWKQLPKLSAGEALTEGGEEVINQLALQWAGDHRDLFTEEGLLDIANVAAAGAVGGGAMGGVAAGAQAGINQAVKQEEAKAARARERAKRRAQAEGRTLAPQLEAVEQQAMPLSPEAIEDIDAAEQLQAEAGRRFPTPALRTAEERQREIDVETAPGEFGQFPRVPEVEGLLAPKAARVPLSREEFAQQAREGISVEEIGGEDVAVRAIAGLEAEAEEALGPGMEVEEVPEVAGRGLAPRTVRAAEAAEREGAAVAALEEEAVRTLGQSPRLPSDVRTQRATRQLEGELEGRLLPFWDYESKVWGLREDATGNVVAAPEGMLTFGSKAEAAEVASDPERGQEVLRAFQEGQELGVLTNAARGAEAPGPGGVLQTQVAGTPAAEIGGLEDGSSLRRAEAAGEAGTSAAQAGEAEEAGASVLRDSVQAELRRELLGPAGGDLGRVQQQEEAAPKAAVTQPVFFSPVQRAVEGLRQKKGTPQQMLAQVRKTPGVKQEELDAIGLEDWVESQEGPVRKEDMLRFVEQGGVKVEEKVLGEPRDLSLEEAKAIAARGGQLYFVPNDVPNNVAGAQLDSGEILPWILENSDKGVLREGNPDSVIRREVGPKFTDWQLPGGENYRELLITLPATGEGDFQSSHFADVPNILVHIRFNERVDAAGRKTLFVEEVQSDWHQKGRKEGYVGTGPTVYRIYDADGGRVNTFPGREEAENALVHFNRPDPAWGELQGGFYIKEEQENVAGVPDAPFKSSWPLLGMKRVMRWAAENGFDQVAWTPGEVQADRYDLSKQVSRVRYERQADQDGGPEAEVGRLDVYDLEDQLILSETVVTEKKLADYIGKEAAERLLKQQGIFRPDRATGFRVREIAGEDLRVGGEGMKAFYDRMLPAAMNKFGKKFGAKVGTTEVETEPSKTQETWFFPITPKLQKQAMEGLPLFAKGGRAPQGASSMEVRQELEGSLGSVMVGRLESSGLLEIHEPGDEKVPEGLKNLQGAKRGGRVTAYWDPKTQKMHLFAGAVPRGQAMGILLHESQHAGLREMLGDGYGELQGQLDGLFREGDEGVRAARLRASNSLPEAMGGEAREARLRDEWMSYFVQGAQGRIEAGEALAPRVRILLRRILDAVRAWFRTTPFGQALAKKGFGGKLDDRMAVALTERALRMKLGQREGGAEAVAAEVAAPLAAVSEPEDYLSANARIRREDEGAGHKLRNLLTRQFAPGGLLRRYAPGAFEVKVQRDQSINAMDDEAEILVKNLDAAVKRGMGKRVVDLPADEMGRLSDSLAGQMDEGLPDGVKEQLGAMRLYIDRLSREYAGILEGQEAELRAQGEDAAAQGQNREAKHAAAAAQAKADLLGVFRNRMGEYVHRSYKVFDDASWAGHVPDDVLDAAREHMMSRDPELTAEAADMKMRMLLEDGTAYDSLEEFLVKENKLGAKDLSILKHRDGGLAPEIRDLLGEYRDPRLNFAKTVAKQARLVFNDRFLTRLKEVGLGEWMWEPGDPTKDPKASHTILGGRGYEPLAGLETYPEVEQALVDALGKEHWPKWLEAIVRANGWVKYSKTVGSPLPTGFRNWVSAFFATVANGHFDMAQTKVAAAAAAEYLGNVDLGKRRDYLRHIRTLGVSHDVPFAGEMKELKREGKIAEQLETTSGALLAGTRQKAAAVLRGMERFYQYGDDFWKIVGFENEKALLQKHIGGRMRGVVEGVEPQRQGTQMVYEAPELGKVTLSYQQPISDKGTGKELKGGWAFVDEFGNNVTPEKETWGGREAAEADAVDVLSLYAIEKQAAARIRDTYMTYSMVGRFMQTLRRFPLAGTFVSFPSEIIRTTAGMLRHTARELRDPDLRQLGIRRTVGLGIMAGLAHGLQSASMGWFGIGEEEEDAWRETAAPWQKNANLLALPKDAEGRHRFADMSYVDLYNYWRRPLNAMMRNEPTEDRLKEAAKEIVEPFFGTDISAQAIFEALSNRKESGGEVYNPEDESARQLGDIASHLWKTIRPGTVSAIENIGKAYRGEVSSGGKVFKPAEEWAALFGGRVSTLDPVAPLHFKGMEFSERKRAASRLLSEVVGDPNPVSDAELAEAFRRANAARRAAYVDFQKMLNAAQKLGTSRRELGGMLRFTSVPRAEIGALLEGKIPPWRPSVSMLGGTQKKAGLVFGKAQEAEVRRRRQFIRRLMLQQ